VVESSEADKALEALSDEQLLLKAFRSSLIGLIALWDEISRRRAHLINNNPAGLGVLVQAMWDCLVVANEIGGPLLERQERERRAAPKQKPNETTRAAQS
jgi:hypothetical protein